MVEQIYDCLRDDQLTEKVKMLANCVNNAVDAISEHEVCQSVRVVVRVDGSNYIDRAHLGELHQVWRLGERYLIIFEAVNENDLEGKYFVSFRLKQFSNYVELYGLDLDLLKGEALLADQENRCECQSNEIGMAIWDALVDRSTSHS